MIEIILYDFLRTELTVPVYLERPERNTPQSFVLIDHTGGNTEEHINYARVALQTYGSSLYESAILAETVKELMLGDSGILTLPSIASVKLNSGPYNFTRADTKEYRYQSVFEITYY